MKVVVVEPGRTPHVKDIDNGLKSMQEVVGGYIEMFYPLDHDDDTVFICNEEGKMNGMEPNRVIRDTRGNLVDVIYGPFFICRAPIWSEDFESLSREQCDKYIQKYML